MGCAARAPMSAPSTAPDLAPESAAPAPPTPHAPPTGRRALALTSLGALGVVYGDIGTSPLYAMKECLAFPASPHAIVRLRSPQQIFPYG